MYCRSRSVARELSCRADSTALRPSCSCAGERSPAAIGLDQRLMATPHQAIAHDESDAITSRNARVEAPNSNE
jgi:hypothetical protein